jgi:hypothetical protein
MLWMLLWRRGPLWAHLGSRLGTCMPLHEALQLVHDALCRLIRVALYLEAHLPQYLLHVPSIVDAALQRAVRRPFAGNATLIRIVAENQRISSACVCLGASTCDARQG